MQEWQFVGETETVCLCVCVYTMCVCEGTREEKSMLRYVLYVYEYGRRGMSECVCAYALCVCVSVLRVRESRWQETHFPREGQTPLFYYLCIIHLPFAHK